MTVGQVRNWSADLGGIWLVYLASKLGNTWDSGRLGGPEPTSISSSSSRPNNTHVFTYDVFLSFRGEDTRHTFTDHLYEALLGAGLRTFRDNDAIDRGQELKPEIETAIINSRASIVVLSENYANSRWCLDELCLILEQRREINHFVIPVFYHVDPADVRKQRGSFAIRRSRCFSSCLACSCMNTKEGSKWTEDNVRRWKAALTEFANLTGMVLSGYICFLFSSYYFWVSNLLV
ncbi:putative TIR domain-containing protein [Helianthus annuus]|nr:putative TIR domain-containing protein [Helianthus annuus]